jgi:6-pyruvoyltetrahydropterin/6-carboxytetrahydropterin synthase
MFEIQVEASFDAAHCLRDYQGACARVHGHTYRVQVLLRGNELSPVGLLVDFRDVKARLRVSIEKLDHHFINEVEPFTLINPTAENLARYFYDELGRGLGPIVAKVTVWETPTACASYYEE